MDHAEGGVIYVSFGTIALGSQVPQDKQEALLNVFGKLKERVLWKWETSAMKEKPSNVMIKDIFPQQDVLAHPNMKAFVTHAGYLSFEESLCHMVPMVSESLLLHWVSMILPGQPVPQYRRGTLHIHSTIIGYPDMILKKSKKSTLSDNFFNEKS